MVESAVDSDILTKRIDIRLNVWNRLWRAFLLAYFVLGTASVALSALAATDVLEGDLRRICSVVAAVCVALIGFLRPEARYKNIVQAWRELDVAKTRFQSGVDSSAERLLRVLARTERIATDDEHGSSKSSEE